MLNEIPAPLFFRECWILLGMNSPMRAKMTL